MDKFMDWLQKQPMFVKVLLAVALLGLAGFGVYKVVGGTKQPDTVEVSSNESVILNVPSASIAEDSEESKTELLNEGILNEKSGKSSLDFFDDDNLSSEDFVMKEETQSKPVNQVFLDPNEYSELEIHFIRNGIKSKEEIDALHAKQRESDEQFQEHIDETRSHIFTPEQLDSIDNANIMRANETAQRALAGKQSNIGMPIETPTQQFQEPQRPDSNVQNTNQDNSQMSSQNKPYRTLPSVSSMTGGDGIINSLESTTLADPENSNIVMSRATFLKSERIVDGQRVIMRLLEDLHLPDGTVIPTNTHISGQCAMGSRLEIYIKSIEYNRRIYYTNMSVFDHDDRTEGIYCPVMHVSKGKKYGKEIGREVTSGIASVAGSILTGNPLLSRSLVTGIDNMGMLVDDQGNTAINIVAGYEFYIFQDFDEFMQDFEEKQKSQNSDY